MTNSMFPSSFAAEPFRHPHSAPPGHSSAGSNGSLTRRLHHGVTLALASLDLLRDAPDLPEHLRPVILAAIAELEPAADDLATWLALAQSGAADPRNVH